MGIILETEKFTPTLSSAEYQPVIDLALKLEGTGEVAKFAVPDDDVAKTERILRELAAKVDRSARFAKSPDGDGKTVIRFWLIPAVKRPRKAAAAPASAKK